MKEPKNIKEFQELVKRYETVTLKEIKDKWIQSYLEADPSPGFETAQEVSDFGGHKCKLCKAVSRVNGFRNCLECVYGKDRGCIDSTYYRIGNADTPRKLFYAFRSRAKHLRETYPQYL